MTWNIQGIRDKLKQHCFVNYCNNFSIFACSEINSCSKDIMEKVFNKYDVYVSYRQHFKGGGIAVFVLKSLSDVITNVSVSLDECIVLILDKKYLKIDRNIICCFPYVPHEYSTALSNYLINGIE